jgi:hypothetical protein
VLVQCPRCSECARVSYVGDDVRLTCTHCGHADSIPKPRRHFEGRPTPSLRAYNEGHPPFGAPLWLETECCGGNRLWALNGRHLDYLERFVLSSNRDADFPSPGGSRQLADKFPAWLVSHKHRDEVVKAIRRLRATL